MDEFKIMPSSEMPEENKNLHHDEENRPKISPILAAFIGLIGVLFLYQVVGSLLTMAILGIDLKNVPVLSERLMIMAGQILFILLPSLIFAKAFYKNVSKVIRFYFPNWEEIFLFTIGLAILIPLIEYYQSIQNHFVDIWVSNSKFLQTIKSYLDVWNDSVTKAMGNLLAAKTIFDGAFIILLVAVIPAVCEEVMFRGYVQKSFEYKLKPFTAALITAVFFGAFHMEPYSFIPLVALGLYFGFAAYKSNSIFVPMSLHFFNNFLMVIFYFIFGDDDVVNNAVTKSFDLLSTLMIFIALIALFAGVVLLIRKYYSRKIIT